MVTVKSIEPLEQMDIALKRFSVEGKEMLQQAKMEIQRTLEHFKRCKEYWTKEVRRTEVQLQQAKVALANCIRSSDDDCVTARQRVKYAKDQLERAQEELKSVKVWKGRIEKAAQNYERQARRLNTDQAKDITKNLRVTVLKNYHSTTNSVSNTVPTLESIEAVEEDEVEFYPETRAAFRGLYQELALTRKPNPETGEIQIPDHAEVIITPKGDVYGPYRKLKAYLSDKRLTSKSRNKEVMGFEAHHLIEDRLLKKFGVSTDEGLAVAIYADEHMQSVHGEFGIDFELPRGYIYDIQDVVDVHIRKYREIGRPEWSEQVIQFVRDNRERVIAVYENDQVPGATDEDIEKVRNYLNSL